MSSRILSEHTGFEMAKNLLQRSPDIETMVDYWEKVCTLFEGYDAVVKAGETFLPRFPEEDDDDFEFRLKYTKLTNVFRDVTEGLATKPFQNEVRLIKGDDKTEIPDFFVNFVEDVDGAGNNLTSFSSLSFFNSIGYGMDWIFVDFPSVNKEIPMSKKEASERNFRPYWTHILAKNVLEVRTMKIGSKEVVSYFRYKEPSYMDQPVYIREYFINSENKVFWRLWLENKEVPEDDENRFVIVESGEMDIDVVPAVPLVLGRRDGNSWRIYPPMQDVVDLQLTLYKNESELEYIKVLAGYPMLATNGMKPAKTEEGQKSKIKIGPNTILFGLPAGDGTGGSWKYVEPSANSMEFLLKNIEKTKQDLRELGRQPLTALSTQLTTVTTSIAAGKAKSTVTTWVYLLKDALENALKLTAKWMNINYEPQVYIFDGFDDVTGSEANLDILLKTREAGDLSREAYLEELKRYKVLSPEFNIQNDSEKLLSEIVDSGEDVDDFNQEGLKQDAKLENR